MTVLSVRSFAAGEIPFIEVDPGSMTALRERGTGKPFVAVGVNYFDHETGWAPKLWQKFDEKRVAHQLDLLRDGGFNTIRVFLTFASFHSEPGAVAPEGEAKFRTLLAMCRQRGIRVIPTGPDHWEGTPAWRKADRFASDVNLEADERWWTAFAGRMKDEPTILAWDVLNEPAVGWDTTDMHVKWNRWLQQEYGGVENIARRWARPIEQVGELGEVPVPPPEAAPGDQRLLAYQRFRESIGDAWTRRMVAAIRAADRNHLATVGHIQWAVPILMPSVAHYAGFDMRENARHVDFVSIHFYPLDSPKPCDTPDGIAANKVYLEAVLHACTLGKPLMLGEFGWYGGGAIGNSLPAQPPEHQRAWCNELLGVTRGRVCGWLNWAMADTQTSTDLTRWSGVYTQDLKLKPWGEAYTAFAREATSKPFAVRTAPAWLQGAAMDRSSLLTSPGSGNAARRALRAAVTRPAPR